MINPNAVEYLENEMWICLGKLFGIAIRTGKPLSIVLPPIFWKKLSMSSLISENEFKTYDQVTYKIREILMNMKKDTKGKTKY